MAGFLSEVAKLSGRSQAILDLLAVEPSLTTEEHEQLGKAVARILSGLQIASVVPYTERIRAGELAAQRHGLNLQTFTNLAEAEDWLRGVR